MVNQVECHPKYPQDQLRARCAELGITVVAYASLGQGELLCDPVVQAVAEACGRTPAQARHPRLFAPYSDCCPWRLGRRQGPSHVWFAQVLLRWGIEKGCCVIPKSVTPARVEGFAEDCLLSWRLGDEEMERLSSLASVPHKFCWDPAGVL